MNQILLNTLCSRHPQASTTDENASHRKVTVPMSRQDKLLATLGLGRRLCDDCLSDIAAIKPRQSVYQACSVLRDEKLITRLTESCEACHRMKITNALISPVQRSAARVPVPVILAAVAATSPTSSRTTSGTSELYALIFRFVESVVANGTEIYNEFSLQHELGIFLRAALPEYVVQFERNVTHFFQSKIAFTKREIDIAVFSKNRMELKYAIELKYPRNGQYPEQMFSFCKDIAFAEELKVAGFSRTALLVFADDHLFYSGSSEGIYGYFRANKPITGRIEKPTGSTSDDVNIRGSYVASWSVVAAKTRFSIVEV